MNMRTVRMGYGMLLCGCLVAGVALMAGPGGPAVANEDVRFIMEWQRSQRLAELADALALSPEQIAELKQAKAQREAIRAEAEPRIETAEAALAEAAGQIRIQLENGGDLSEADQELLREHLAALAELRAESRHAVAEVGESLEGLLTEEQRDAIRQWFRSRMEARAFTAHGDDESGLEPGSGAPGTTGMMRRHRMGRASHDGRGPSGSPRGRGQGRRGDEGHRGEMRAHFIEHVLLSDAFLSNFE